MATAAKVEGAEARLGVRLPPSYRAAILSAEPSLPGEHGMSLLSVDEIDRFRVRERDWFNAWMEGVELGRDTYGDQRLADDPGDPATAPMEALGDSIVISTTDDERVILLNPARSDQSGEWEAWDLATWYPGAYRYPSYQRLVEALAAE